MFLKIAMALSFTLAAQAAIAAPVSFEREADPNHFQVLSDRPISEFAHVIAGPDGAAYYFDQHTDVVRLAPAFGPHRQWKATTLYHFSNVDTLGSGHFLFGLGGAIFGAAEFGGAPGCGDVYELTPPGNGIGPWSYSEVYAFACRRAGNALLAGNIARDAAGDLYGAGEDNVGEFFYELTPPSSPGGQWSERTLYHGKGTIVEAISIDSSNDLYFVDFRDLDGPDRFSKLTPPARGKGSWKRTVLFSSQSVRSTDLPLAGPNGVVYGTSNDGGCGKVFGLIPQEGGSYSYQTVYAFSCRGPGGADPVSVIPASSGRLFGTAFYGGSGNAGVVFELQQTQPGGAWTETTLHIFQRGRLGSCPTGVTFGPGKSLYGETLFGGANPPIGGTVFKLDR